MMRLRHTFLLAGAALVQACSTADAPLDAYVAEMNAAPDIAIADAYTRRNDPNADVEIHFEEGPELTDPDDKSRPMFFLLAGPNARARHLAATMAAACANTRAYSKEEENKVRPITIVPVVRDQDRSRLRHDGRLNKSWLAGLQWAGDELVPDATSDVTEPNDAVGLLFVEGQTTYDVFHALKEDQTFLNFKSGKILIRPKSDTVQVTDRDVTELLEKAVSVQPEDSAAARDALQRAVYVPLDRFDEDVVIKLVRLALESSVKGDMQTIRSTVQGLRRVREYEEFVRVIPGVSLFEGVFGKGGAGEAGDFSQADLDQLCQQGAG